MQIEQSADLNRYVDSSIPLTWTLRWRMLKTVMPLLCCCSVLMVETLVLRLWLNDRKLTTALPLLLLCAVTPCAAVLVACELQLRIGHRTSRKLKLEPKRVSISPAKCSRIPWQRILGWQLEPVSAAQGLSKLTIEYAFRKNARRKWSIVLRQADQEQALVSELEFFRQAGSNVAPLIRCSEPSATRPTRQPAFGLLALGLSLLCIVHGLPLLVVGLFPPAKRPDEPRAASRLTERESAKLGRISARFFSSKRSFRTFLVLAGGSATAAGAFLYILSLRSLNKTALLEMKGLVSAQPPSPRAP